ncbi:hypothetical protein KP509_10G005600 [Ceratopteris richardii]|nr:hypothetical protein KP509_10G005600 [Ceratopteris richardii]
MLEQKAISLVSSSGSVLSGDSNVHVINIIAEMVVNQMGGPVEDEKIFLRTWNSSIATLRSNVGSVVLPLGKLNVGLGRHRALLFKVLADAIGIPCQVVKGRQYILNDEAVVIVIKDDLGREFIVDLIAVPGLLIPYDASLFSSTVPKSREAENVAIDDVARSVQEASVPQVVKKLLKESHATPMQWPKRSVVHRRSPSWTEGVGLAGSRDLNVNDVSQYLINAAKDNALRAQKLDEVPIASSVEAPLDSFLENSQKELQMRYDEWKSVNENQKIIRSRGDAIRRRQQSSVGPGRPPLLIESQSPISDEGREKLHRLNSVEGLGDRHPLDFGIASVSQSSSPNSSASSAAATTQSTSPVLPAVTNPTLVHEGLPPELIKGPVAAAAATAAVVASSMLVAATKSEHAVDPAMDVPVAVAATATAAVVAATTAVVGRRVELTVPETVKEEPAEKDVHGVEQKYVDDNSRQQFSENLVPEGAGSGGAERVSDKSTGSLSSKSDRVLDDVAEFEISWEDLNIGERIGLGSYGEVYRGDWHGTEVAVKKFLDQDISGDALLEFASEVRLMKRMRHPNVVLFMGAVMHPPNLSIVTEFLPRGSLYRLIHRSSNQIDERRRMRMALDVAKGMNYLHNCTPIIVHRDLKSPNLLVDKNWVVKVCDFGLSRMKHSTFLSTKSTAGTPEWMAPEVLRNEPSNEKSDVYSFGVVLWELVTLQQPWANMNPMQVVGAVGFQHRNLDIPEDVDPVIVRIIRQCWQSDPGLRPSFAEIINILKPLQKPITASQVSKS